MLWLCPGPLLWDMMAALRRGSTNYAASTMIPLYDPLKAVHIPPPPPPPPPCTLINLQRWYAWRYVWYLRIGIWLPCWSFGQSLWSTALRTVKRHVTSDIQYALVITIIFEVLNSHCRSWNTISSSIHYTPSRSAIIQIVCPCNNILFWK